MKFNIKNIFEVFIIFTLFAYPSRLAGKTKLFVVTSIFPLQEFAKAVGGERIKADLLIPPGTDPHTWEPRPSDIANISKADTFIYVGAGMEPWLQDVLEGTKHDSLAIIEVSEGADVIYDEEDVKYKGNKNNHTRSLDPHIWLDLKRDLVILDKIANFFSKRDPEGREFYIQNAINYKKKLSDLDKMFTEGLKNCEKKEIFLCGHSAFAYMAKRYGLNQVPLYGISPDAEPSPGNMAHLIDFARKNGIKAIFFERLTNSAIARIMAEEIGAETLVLNPGLNITKDEMEKGITFISIMEENLKNLKKGLGCD